MPVAQRRRGWGRACIRPRAHPGAAASGPALEERTEHQGQRGGHGRVGAQGVLRGARSCAHAACGAHAPRYAAAGDRAGVRDAHVCKASSQARALL